MTLPTPLFAGATLAGASSPYTIQRSDVADPAGSGATVCMTNYNVVCTGSVPW